MRAKSEYPTRHADQHNPDGSDPLSGFIRYDFLNVGDWLYIETTNRGGPDSAGIEFVDSGGRDIKFRSDGGAISFDKPTGPGHSFPTLIGNIDSVDLQAQAGDITIQTNTGDMRLTAAGDSDVGAGAVLNLSSGTGNIGINSGVDLLVSSQGLMQFQSIGDDTTISSAGLVSISANSLIELDVGAGQTVTFKDHLGNPKIRWTEGTNDLHIPTGGTIVADL